MLPILHLLISRIAGRLALACVLMGAAWGAVAGELNGFEAELRQMAQAHARQLGATAQKITRIEVSVGELDPRIRLAPCARMEPYLPPGMKPWGRTRLGVRCVEGPTRWNVYLPLTVQAFGQALAATAPVAAGQTLSPGMLHLTEVDFAADPSPALVDASTVTNRTLARPLSAGQPLRKSHLRPKQWFAAGDRVKVLAVGRGFAISSEGQALTAGIEGVPTRVRAANGRIVTGQARADRTVEVQL